MKIWEAILKVLARFTKETKRRELLLREFCGVQGHTSDECPNAAKFKLFQNDKE